MLGLASIELRSYQWLVIFPKRRISVCGLLKSSFYNGIFWMTEEGIFLLREKRLYIRMQNTESFVNPWNQPFVWNQWVENPRELIVEAYLKRLKNRSWENGWKKRSNLVKCYKVHQIFVYLIKYQLSTSANHLSWS